MKQRTTAVLKQAGLVAGIVACTGLAHGATITGWDTATVKMYDGAVELYGVYTNVVHKDVTLSYPTGGISWTERDTQSPGLSVVNKDDKDGSNCIMSAGINPSDGTIKQCSDPFQSSKRFKSVLYKSGEPLVLRFNVTEDGTVKTYRMLQKLSNKTGVEVKDFTIELGFEDANGTFIKSTVDDGLGISSEAGQFWSAPTGLSQTLQKDLSALFAHGLFGEEDKHHPEPGYYNPNVRAEFDLVVEEDRMVSAGISSVHSNLFGQWQTAPITIYGMYWDHDQLWYTDNILLANCKSGFNETTGVCAGGWETYREKEGVYPDPLTGELRPYLSDGIPKPISSALLTQWAADPWTAPGPIDDFANINLNYFITIGSTAKWPTPKSFAIRFIPNAGTVPPKVVDTGLTVTSVSAPKSVK